MKPFTYERARSPAEAAAAAARTPGAKFIAGGTNLLDLMKLRDRDAGAPDRRQRPRRSTRSKPTPDGGLRIGALVRNTDLAADARVRRDYGVLSRALLAGASGQLRNKATTAGNLLQRTRCPYFYDTNQPCNKRQPGSGCAAIGGFSRQHGDHRRQRACIATHPERHGGGHARARRARSRRCGPTARRARIPIADFHRLPGDTPHIETTLAARRTDHRGDAAASRSAARTSIARCATARPMRSRWSRSRPIVQRDGTRPRRARRRRAQAVARRGRRSASCRSGAKAVADAAARRRQADPRQRIQAAAGRAHARLRCWPKRGADAMKFDTPATTNPIDQLKVVGKPTDRIDGPLKTTGTAPYAYERHDVVPNQAYGYVVGAAIAKGRISVDRSRRRPRPRPACSPSSPPTMPASSARASSTPPSCSAARRSSTTTRRSRWSSRRPSSRRAPPRSWSQVDYVARRGRVRSRRREATTASSPAKYGRPADTAVGDFAGAFAAAPVKLDATYTTPDQAHAMMEPHASIAAWEGDKLTLWTSNQMIDWGRGDMAKTLGIPKENVRLISPYHRRRLRRQAVHARRRGAGRARRARGRPAGEGGAAAPADVQQHHPPAGDDPAHPHRRDARRQDHRDRPRKLVGRSARRQARGRGAARRGCSMPARTA